MSITVTDPHLLAHLADASDVVELKDPAGRVIGTFAPEGLGRLPPGVRSPFTDEQLADLRAQRTGRPLADVLKDLRERA